MSEHPAERPAEAPAAAPLDVALQSSPEAVVGILRRLLAEGDGVEIDHARTLALSRWLDDNRRRGAPDTIVEALALLRLAADRVTWAQADREHALAYLLPIAVDRGPGFFQAEVAPWLAGPVSTPRFAHDLACYQAHHGEPDELCTAVARAVAVGRRPEQLAADPDLAPRLGTPAVQRLLSELTPAPRYSLVARLPWDEAPCRLLETGWRPGQPAWEKLRWNRGLPMAQLPEGPLRARLRPQEPDDSGVLSLPQLFPGRIPVMHGRLAAILQTMGARMQTVPLVIEESDGGRTHEGWGVVNVIGRLPLDTLRAYHRAAVQDPTTPLPEGTVLGWEPDNDDLVAHSTVLAALQAAGFDELSTHEIPGA